MSRVLRASEVPIGEVELSIPEKLRGMLPVITPIYVGHATRGHALALSAEVADVWLGR